MFLNNYYNYLDKVFSINSSSGNYVNLVSTDGNTQQFNVSNYLLSPIFGFGKPYTYTGNQTDNYLSSSIGMGSDTFDLIIGSGTTEVTLDDYKLEEQLLLDSYETRQTISYIDNETGRRVLLNQKTYTNNKDSTVSVSEIGWLVYSRILIYREVLDNPISLLPGESVTISLKRFLN